jgi:hypothetical protein
MLAQKDIFEAQNSNQQCHPREGQGGDQHDYNKESSFTHRTSDRTPSTHPQAVSQSDKAYMAVATIFSLGLLFYANIQVHYGFCIYVHL